MAFITTTAGLPERILSLEGLTDHHRHRGVGKSKLDQYRPEIAALLSNSSTPTFIARRYGTTEANLSR